MKKTFDILVGGHICLDIIPDLSALKNSSEDLSTAIIPGKLINIGSCAISTGGAVSNTGFALSKLGAKVAFSCKIGDDEFGKIILSRMKKYGSVEAVSITKKFDSSYTIVISPPHTDRTFLHCTGANDDYSSKDLPLNMLRNSKIFHFGYPPLMKKIAKNEGDELKKIFNVAKNAACATSLDMSLPDPDSFYGQLDWKKILQKILPLTDIFMPSLEEAFFMFDKSAYLRKKKEIGGADITFCLSSAEIAKIAEESLKLGTSISVLKLGTRGWLLKTGKIKSSSPLAKILGKNLQKWQNRTLWCPAYKAENFVGSTGSGDCSIAGFLRAICAQMFPEQALKAAVCVGWQNVQAADSLSGIRTWKETVQIIQTDNLNTFDPELRDPNWHFDKKNKIWKNITDGETEK